MVPIALKMLFGDPAKYKSLIFGVTFATLLMAQQTSIFIGLMGRTASAIFSVSEADIWVVDKRVRYIDEIEPLRDVELSKVRSVKGVKWAVPFYKGLTTMRMPDGLTQQVQLIGVDDVSLVGMCPNVLMGDLLSIKKPQTAMIDKNGFLFTWPNQQLKLGKYIEINDFRLKIDAICDVEPTFMTFPILYVSYSTAVEILPPQRNRISVVLVKAKEGHDLKKLTKCISDQTGLQALTQKEFAWRSIHYILERTGIPINFAITIFLGILIGAAITAQTFYIFIVENLKQFAVMKAVGVTNKQLLGMVLAQAGVVGITGYGLGIGFTALFFKLTANAPALKGFMLLWQVMASTAGVIAIIILFLIIFSLRKVFKLDPGIVFRG